MEAEVILTPAEIARLPERDLSTTVCVVFDVLRATSTMLTAFAHGARRIFPVRTIEEARLLHRSKLPDALLGGERGGVRIEGFDLGNSPREYTPEVVAGRDIITTTTNGTVALSACAGAKAVLAGAWLNLDALGAYLLRPDNSVGRLALVCAGTGERFALEDGLAVGALLARLPAASLDDAAQAMLALHARWRDKPLLGMQGGENGQRLAEIGLAADVEWCARTSALPWVAVLRDGALEGKASPVT